MQKEIKILIVDDDRLSRRLISDILARANEGFISDEAIDLPTIKARLSEKKYDCLILDYVLKNTDGLAIVEEIKNMGVSIPIVMLTGIGSEMLAVKAMKTGIYDYLPKKILGDPESRDVLKLSILKAIDHHRANEERLRSEIALKKSEERYRALVENSPILILRFFPDDHKISFVNDGYCLYYGVTRVYVLGEDYFSTIPVDQRPYVTSILNSLNKKHEYDSFETNFLMNGAIRHILWTIQALFSEDGGILEYQCMGEDITNLKRAEDEIIKQRQYLQSILDSQDNMLAVIVNDAIVNCNRSFLTFFGRDSIEEFLKDHPHLEDLAIEEEGYISNKSGKTWIHDIFYHERSENLMALRDKNGNPRIFSLNINSMIGENEGYIIEFTDVTGLETNRKSFETKASIDTLTGIYNRRKFDEILEERARDCWKRKASLSVIYFDIDHFKKINDTYGHHTGDYVLKTLASAVKSSIRESDIFARWGGEEFAILLPSTEVKSAIKLAEKLRLVIRQYEFDSVKTVTTSFGVTSLQADDTIDSFMKRADRALYHAKESGRDRVTAMQKKE